MARWWWYYSSVTCVSTLAICMYAVKNIWNAPPLRSPLAERTYSDRFIDGIKWRCYYGALHTYVLVWMLFYFMNCQFFKRSNHEPAFFTFPLVCICFLTTWISITILTFKLFCFVIKDSTMVIDSVLQLNYLGHLITYKMSDVIQF